MREAGDAGLLLELDPVIDAAVNARAVGIAEAFRQKALPGVRDVVPTYRSVAVHFDPESADGDFLKAALEEAGTVATPQVEGALVEIPVRYGGDAGPDLETVAKHAGLSAAAVVSRHAGTEYRVFMLGFMPGFAYMGSVDASIAAPRRSSPRVRVPAGSVGIAGRQTGVYPFDSPGGWQIIGRTGVSMFDASRARPALCAPGDRVRFVESVSDDSSPRGVNAQPDAAGRVSPHADIVVIRPGLLTTIQDAGRWGHQASGVTVSGAMDGAARRTANAAVGNDPQAAVLEATLLGPELRFESPRTIAVAGADLGASLDGKAVPLELPVSCPAGSVLRFGERRRGGRACIAVDGGLAVPPVLGSRSTHTRTAMGGLHGRPLRAGDVLQTDRPSSFRTASATRAARATRTERGDVTGIVTLRILPGPQDEWFPADALERLQSMRFIVHPQSDRMGLRLTSSGVIPRLRDDEMISDATFPGALQVPASGEPILLMADRPTSGGYPQLAVVISADLPMAGQLVPGDALMFAVCSLADGRAALGTSPRVGDQ